MDEAGLQYSRRIAGLISLRTQQHRRSHCLAGLLGTARGKIMRQLAFSGEREHGLAWHASSISVPLCPLLLWLCNLRPYFKIGRHQQQQQVWHCSDRLLTMQRSSPEAGHCGQKLGGCGLGRWTAVATGQRQSGVAQGEVTVSIWVLRPCFGGRCSLRGRLALKSSLTAIGP